MHEDHYTVVVVPAAAGKPRRYAISKTTVKALIIGSGGLLVALTLVASHHFLLWREVAKYKAERHVVQQERAKITSLALSMERLKVKMQKLQEFDHKLRIIADLPEIEEPDETLGVGGTVLDTEEEIDREMADFTENAGALQDTIEGLEEQAAFQEESFYELIEFLEERKSILLATPSIRPTRGFASSGFGYRKSPFTGERDFHRGVDIATRMGTPVVATADGIVILSLIHI